MLNKKWCWYQYFLDSVYFFCLYSTMTLKTWAQINRQEGETILGVYQRLSESVGVSPRYLYFISLGACKPGHELVKKIHKATKGQVGIFDLLPDMAEAV